MDSLGKALKTGLAKAYAAGQQQVQQRVSRLQDQSSGSRPPQGSSYSGGQYAGGQQSSGQYDSRYYDAAPQQQTQHAVYSNAAVSPNSATQNPAASYGSPNAATVPYFPPPPNQLGGDSGNSVPQFHSHPHAPVSVSAGHQTTYESCPIPPEYPRPISFEQPVSPATLAVHGQAGQPPLSNSQSPRYYSYPPAPPPSTPYVPPNASQYQQWHDYSAPPAPYIPPRNSQQNNAHMHPTARPHAVQNAPTVPTAYTPAPPLSTSDAYSSTSTALSSHEAVASLPVGSTSTVPRRRPVPMDNTTRTDAHVRNSSAYDSQSPPPPPQVPPATAHDTPGTQSHSTPSSYHSAPPCGDGARYAQDSIGQLSTGMNMLNVNASTPEYQEMPSSAPAGRAAKRLLSQMRANGEPNDIVRFCTETRVVDYALDWYHLEGVPSYLICTRCHAENIKNTPLESQFTRIKRPDGSSSVCGFYYPRVRDRLWPSALCSNSTDALRAFMLKRIDIPTCKGANVVTAADGLKWFGMAAKDIEGFVACEACYQDSVIGTTFEARFTPYQQQGPSDKWTCDMQIPYIMRAATDFSRRNDWQGFVAAATKRCQAPACEGRDVELNSLTWYLPRRNIDNFHVCETCYLDKLAYTEFQHEFEAHPPKAGFDAWMEMLGKRRTCDLSSGKLPIAFALEAALFTNDFYGFAQCASKISSLVPCSATGIIRGNWWTISGGCPDFSICEACYTGILQPHRLECFFETATRDAEATIVCSFCVSSPRFKQYMIKLVQSFDTGIFGPFIDFVSTFAGVQVCAGIKNREKTKWWGYPEALFCENCYLSFVTDTPLGSELTFKGEYDERFQICQIWSPRMRDMWLKACEAGKPGSEESNAALKEFKEFASRRLQVWIQTIPRIEFIQQMKQMKMMTAMHQGQLSLMYSGMNSIAVLSDTTDGNLHGNSSIGWYETEHGATGAQLFNNMQAGMANANREDEWAEVLRLERMWTEVE